MKKCRSLLSVLLLGVLLFLSSCNNSKSPEAVAEKFLTLMQEGKVSEAKELCDDQTKNLLSMAEGMIAKGVETAKKNGEKVKEFKVISSEINADKAVVKYTLSNAGSENEAKVDLKKVNDEWKVTMNKEGASK